MQTHPRLADQPVRPRPMAAPATRLKSQDLFKGGHEIVIEHHGAEYRLRLTRNDKLILNK
jgi:hemin uptake protein HemP